MEERFKLYDTIFIGVVTKIEPNKNYDVLPPDGNGTEATINFDVKRIIKGEYKESVTVQAQGIKSMWQHAFQKNKRYLVYTQNRNGSIEFPVCGSMIPYNLYTSHDIEGDLKSTLKREK
jgi:hypothetical protein